MRQSDDSFDLNTSPELLRLAEETRASGKPRVLRRNGEAIAVLLPFSGQESGRLKRRQLSAQDIDDFRAAAGTWADVNLHDFLAGVYAARDVLEDRPPVDL